MSWISHYAPLSWLLLAEAAMLAILLGIKAMAELRPAIQPLSAEQRRQHEIAREIAELRGAIVDVGRHIARDAGSVTAGELALALRHSPSFWVIRPWLSRQSIGFVNLYTQPSHTAESADRLGSMLCAELKRLTQWVDRQASAEEPS